MHTSARVGQLRWPVGEKVMVSGRSQRVEAPFWHPLHLRMLWQFIIRPLIQWELRHPDMGWKLLILTDPKVARFPATGTALFEIATYPGFWGTLRQCRNPFIAVLRVLHENSLNSTAVRYRSVIATQWLSGLIESEGVRTVADLGAGSALTVWDAMKATGRSVKLVAVDFDPYSLLNLRQAAAHTGLLGKVPILPALVLNQGVDGRTMSERVAVTLPRIKRKTRLLGGETGLVREGLVPQGSHLLQAALSGLGAEGGVIPVLGDAHNLVPFLGDARADALLMLGVLDYDTETQLRGHLRQAVQAVRSGGYVILAHMRPNVEIDWVRAVPWRLATEAGAVLRPKSTADFVRMVEGSDSVRILKISLTPNGVYTLVLGQRHG